MGRPDEARRLIVALLAEISDEQARLRERLEMLSNASFEGIMIHSDSAMIDVNDRLSELLGFSREELLAPGLHEKVTAPEDLPGVLQRIAARQEGEYVITAIRKDGTRFRAELASKQGRLGDRPVRVVAVRDGTERERVTSLLRESESRFRELAAATFDYTVFSRDGVVVAAEGDVESVLGRSGAELVGHPILDFIAPSGQPIAREMIRRNRYGAYETAALGADGESIPTLVVTAAATLDGQPVRVAGVRDLRPARRLEAERRALEQQVERAQRLDSLGVLAGGIAHDFNNLLAGILGNAELLAETSGEDREEVRAIITAAQRAAALTRQMLAYAGQRDLGRREPVDVGVVLRELRALLDATLSKKARLELAIEPGSFVLGDRSTIGQVLMNLLTNASDALGDAAGEIHVAARPVREVDARWDAAQGATVKPGRWVLIEVRDTGVGMDEATRGRVFEPFFSTKEKGHGLGLAACLGIISSHGGAVLVESQPGHGSTFSILLPASEATARALDAEPPRVRATPCRVLVVDDEGLVRAQLRRSLELRGYTVDEAPDGRAALDALLGPSPGPKPDVVVLDMTMPDIDGADVLRRVRAAGSRVPVVISSGYLDVSVERRLPLGQFQGFLAKPYGATDLVDAIERARSA